MEVLRNLCMQIDSSPTHVYVKAAVLSLHTMKISQVLTYKRKHNALFSNMSDGRNSSDPAVKVVKNKQRNCNPPQNLLPHSQESSNPGRFGLSPPVENSNPHGFEVSIPVESLDLDRMAVSTAIESCNPCGFVFSTAVVLILLSFLHLSLFGLNIIRILGQFYSLNMFVL